MPASTPTVPARIRTPTMRSRVPRIWSRSPPPAAVSGVHSTLQRQWPSARNRTPRRIHTAGAMMRIERAVGEDPEPDGGDTPAAGGRPAGQGRVRRHAPLPTGPPRPAGPGDDGPRRQVHGDRDHGQHQGQLGQGGHGEAGAVGLRAVELGQNGGGDGAEGLVDVGRDAQRGAADEHDGDGLAEGPAQPEHGAADDARAHPGQRDAVGHLPVRHAQRLAALLRERGHLHEELARRRGDDGDDHHPEHEPCRQQALAASRRVAGSS